MLVENKRNRMQGGMKVAVYREAAERLVNIYDFDWDSNLRMKEACICSVENVIANIVDVIIVFTLAYVTGVMGEVLLYFLTFGLLRMYAGGAHAKNYFRCITIYLCVMYVCIYTSRLLMGAPVGVMLLICGASILVSGWINSRYAGGQKHVGARSRMYRKRALFIHHLVSMMLMVGCIVYLLSSWEALQKMVFLQAFALVIPSILLIVEKRQCEKQEREEVAS